MLSNSAFNAFLKTLEEPPSYAIFILATTEKHKILPTIISRCQAFDFQRILPQEIVQQLKEIAEKENIIYEEEALHLISQKADGSSRDALSMFDLITTFESGNQLTYQATLNNLHLLDYDYYFQFTQALFEGDITRTLLLYDEVLRMGFDSHQLIVGICEHFRNLMVCKDEATLSLLPVSTGIRERYRTQAIATDLSFLFKALELTNQCDIHYKNSKNKRLHIELALLKIAQIQGPVIVPSTPTAAAPSSLSEIPTPTPPTKQTFPISSSIEVVPPSPEREKPLPSTTPKQTPLPSNATVPPSSSILKSTLKIPSINKLKENYDTSSTTIKTATDPSPVDASTLAQPFTQDELQSHWDTYLKQLKQANRLPAYSALNQKIDRLAETITLHLTNSVQEHILEEEKGDLLTYLRTKLNNDNIQLVTNIITEERINKPYTNREKFEHLAKQNPHLHQLQQTLDLEIDC